mmetsp:Transcript_15000/g.32119  ORF Transcript_15000/g.32119 Transcript_15000/m.32119 type:complete len:296 (+) Transcript_15000:194-1081(+)
MCIVYIVFILLYGAARITAFFRAMPPDFFAVAVGFAALLFLGDPPAVSLPLLAVAGPIEFTLSVFADDNAFVVLVIRIHFRKFWVRFRIGPDRNLELVHVEFSGVVLAPGKELAAVLIEAPEGSLALVAAQPVLVGVNDSKDILLVVGKTHGGGVERVGVLVFWVIAEGTPDATVLDDCPGIILRVFVGREFDDVICAGGLLWFGGVLDVGDCHNCVEAVVGVAGVLDLDAAAFLVVEVLDDIGLSNAQGRVLGGRTVFLGKASFLANHCDFVFVFYGVPVDAILAVVSNVVICL